MHKHDLNRVGFYSKEDMAGVEHEKHLTADS